MRTPVVEPGLGGEILLRGTVARHTSRKRHTFAAQSHSALPQRSAARPGSRLGWGLARGRAVKVPNTHVVAAAHGAEVTASAPPSPVRESFSRACVWFQTCARAVAPPPPPLQVQLTRVWTTATLSFSRTRGRPGPLVGRTAARRQRCHCLNSRRAPRAAPQGPFL